MQHRAITSPVFELLETFEFDMALGEDDFWPTRVELYRARGNPKIFRCRVWQVETYRIQATFPQRDDGIPAHDPSDESLLVDYSGYLRCDWNPAQFEAGSVDDARRMVEDALLAFLDHATARPEPS